MSKHFLNKWINQEEKAQVALLCAPFAFPPMPSIALSIFKSALEQADITSKVIYPMFPMIHMIGKETGIRLFRNKFILKNVEYIFAHLTDVSASVPADQFIRTFAPLNLSEEGIEYLTKLLMQAMKAAEEIVEAAAERIVNMGARIVAASSIYNQQNASLAILKRVKELDPSVYTILGGHNVSGEIGMTILRNFPSVDYISFGEGDETIAEVCSNLLTNSNRPMPYGVLGRGEPYPETAPFRMTKDMNGVAFPDYRDFFDEIKMVKDGYYGADTFWRTTSYERIVFLEGSRGCWWGAIRPCSFCSMNGLNNVYREKTPEKLYSEIRKISEQYPGSSIQLSDNVLSSHMIRELLPLLTKDQESYSLFAEIKTNLRSSEIQALSEAGFHLTQPGVESLNDHLLDLMGKGNSAIQNVALLKYCRSFHVFPTWNIMTRIPGENREDYEQMLDILPLLSHLHPPGKVSVVGFMRFSRYGDHPEDYGLELKPDSLYRCCFRDRPDIVNNIGIYYEVAGGAFADTIRENSDLYGQIKEAVEEWKKESGSEKPPVLLMTETGSGILIDDTRNCTEEESCLLTGIKAEIYRLAWEPVSMLSLLKRLPEYSEDEIRENLDDLVSKKLVLLLSGKYLALAVQNRNCAKRL